MAIPTKKLSNPFSTGGGGGLFESHVQASFVTLMLTNGYAPALPNRRIRKVLLQGKVEGFELDDFVVFVGEEGGNDDQKLVCQVKHSLSFTSGDLVFEEVISAAWADYNNHVVFNKGRDLMAIITGPLSKTDVNSVRPLLEAARHTGSHTVFFQRVNLGNFASDDQRSKLNAFRSKLKAANGGTDVDDQTTFDFLRHFHVLGYDLDLRAGVTLSLVHSLIGQRSQMGANVIWSLIVGYVQQMNKHAGAITLESIPEEIRSALTPYEVQTIPAGLVQVQMPQVPIQVSILDPKDLLLACMLGAWNEGATSDRAVIERLSRSKFGDWLDRVRTDLQSPAPRLIVKEGVWRVVDRQSLWKEMGSLLLDDDLNTFKSVAIEVLGEDDPQFELPAGERFGAGFHGKTLTHSSDLRKGIAEGLAYMGNASTTFTHCSTGRTTSVVGSIVHELLIDLRWIRWASLNELLPHLAEAAPQEFTSAIDTMLSQRPSLFADLVAQEGDGIFGGSTISGLLWALETLAWEVRYFASSVLYLAEMAEVDPGGRIANRPSNSLTTILLPWLPQTTAPIEKRGEVVNSILHKVPDVGWKLLLSLMPNSHSVSSGTRRPVWRKEVSSDWRREIPPEEYWAQSELYCGLLVEHAEGSTERQVELIGKMGDLTSKARAAFLEQLKTNSISGLLEEKRRPIWDALTSVVTKHRKFVGTGWAMPEETLELIDSIATQIAPSSPLLRHQKLFGDRETELYEEKGNYTEQHAALEVRRGAAVNEILTSGGPEAILKFAREVKNASVVGYHLGRSQLHERIGLILPGLLISEDTQMARLAEGFVRGRFDSDGWDWADATISEEWSQLQILKFLFVLPFTPETWDKANDLLGDHVDEYWSIVPVIEYQEGADLNRAAEKLIECNRPNAALSCIHAKYHKTKTVEFKLAKRALLDGVRPMEGDHPIDPYTTTEVIKGLQDLVPGEEDELADIEWAYLSILDGHHGDVLPVNLWKRVAKDSEYFLALIRTAYRPKDAPEQRPEISEETKAVALNAYRCLRGWGSLPGLGPDNSVDEESLMDWLSEVKRKAGESGHLGVAMITLGGALSHAPEDPSGLWLHRAVARVLEQSDAEDIRNGFCNALFNSRGVHGYSAGREERKISAGYLSKAEAVESAGYIRLAAALRELADSYERIANLEQNNSPFPDSPGEDLESDEGDGLQVLG